MKFFFQVAFWLRLFFARDRSIRLLVTTLIVRVYCVNPQWSRATAASSKDLPWEDIKLLTQYRAHLRSVPGRNS